MSVKLKKLSDQVIVITGASSGIGLVTARTAAARGARVVVAARTEEALRKLVEEIASKGGQADYVVADVGNRDQVRRIASVAIERFGKCQARSFIRVNQTHQFARVVRTARNA